MILKNKLSLILSTGGSTSFLEFWFPRKLKSFLGRTGSQREVPAL
jgi:hypothetical protein